jgi:hypothetical protein
MLLKSLLNELSNWTAIKKDSGKIVSFMSKQTRDAAIKKGTHIDSKTNKPTQKNKKANPKKPVSKPKRANVFGTNKKEEPIKSPNVPIKSRTLDTIGNLYDNMISRWTGEKQKSVLKIEKAAIKKQGEWVKNVFKTGVSVDKYDTIMYNWQNKADKGSLKSIDKLLKNHPPPPIETKEPIYRGIILSKKEYTKLLEDFNNKKNIKLPISSFTTSFETAADFANPIEHPLMIKTGDKPYSVVFRVKSECDKLNAFSMNSNIASIRLKLNGLVQSFSHEHEVLMPSNQKYKVDKINYVKFSDKKSFAKSMAFIDLVQTCTQNEAIEDDVDLTNDEFYTNIFQTHMRLDKEGD